MIDSVIDILKGAKSEIIGGLVLAVLGWLYTRFRAMRKIYIREKHELERIREEMSQLNATKQEVERLQGLLKESESKSQELQSQLEQLHSELERRNEALKQSESKSQELQSQLEILQQELTQLKIRKKRPLLSDSDFIELCKSGDVKKVEEALIDGANVNAKDNAGITVLMWAALKAKTDLVKLLLERGSDINARDKLYDRTALTWATVKGNLEIAGLLRSHGAR